jgi:Trk-type K+ transport system membrane component
VGIRAEGFLKGRDNMILAFLTWWQWLGIVGIIALIVILKIVRAKQMQ